MAPKVDLAASWAPFGEGLGRSWGSFGSSWALPGRFFGVWKRPLIKHWSTMGSKRPSSSILEPPGLNFGAPGPRFWSLWASIFKLPGVVLPSLGCSCFLLLSLACSCFPFLALACSCFLLLSLACSCFLFLALAFSCFLSCFGCAFRSIAAQVFLGGASADDGKRRTAVLGVLGGSKIRGEFEGGMSWERILSGRVGG